MKMNNSCRFESFPLASVLCGRPSAVANVEGSADYPNLRGKVRFFQTREGVIVFADVSGLPISGSSCGDSVFGFHIHSGTSCSGDSDDPFSEAMSHYNPNGSIHPYHAGDLPPLFGNGGHAVVAFLTDRFSVDAVIGKVVIIHDKPDDFTSQPSGSSGTKIACGVIKKNGTPC